MEIMYNKTGEQFKAISGPSGTIRTLDMIFIGSYPSAEKMIEYTKTLDSSLILPQAYIDLNFMSFKTPELNMGVWFQIPVIPAEPKMIYFLQADNSVKLYKLENITISTISFGRTISSHEEQGWLKYK